MSENQGLLLNNVSSNRITVASKTTTPLGSLLLPAQSTDVCVKHSREWELYDTSGQRFILNEYHTADTTRYGTLTLPGTKAYKGLQYAITNTSHTENQVMARQAQCPYDLSLHEYTAFGTLRSGSNLQWMNISRAFATRSLTFNAQPVYVLISQAAQQIGKLSSESGTPVWHVELKSPSFCESLLKVMKKGLDDSVDNWREVATVKTIRTLAAQSAHNLLRTARDTTYKWLKSIIVQLETTPQGEVDTIKARICEIAATCCLTFDVDNPEFSNSNLSILIHSFIAINANSPSKRDTSSSPSRLLLDCVQRLFHSLEGRIWDQICVDAQGLDDAVRAIWSVYQPGSVWQRMASPNDRWLSCKTQSGQGRASQNVQINLLSGELFIDGKPIGNLPKKITEDPVYTRLFGKVFFATKENGSVVIRTRSLKTAFEPFLEYIPPTTFAGDVPVPFVEDYVHWLDLDSHLIELRPLKSLWEPSSKNWNIDFDAKVMKDDRGHALVEKNSPSFQMVYQRIQSIEDSSFVVITKDGGMNLLNVHLPRLHLEFFLDPVEGELESRTYPDNIVAEDQSLQTLYGLQSKLVLRQRRSPGADPDLPEIRRVLIPRGVVKFSPSADGNHVEVLIDTDVMNKRTVPYLEYTANTKLGMLVGNGSLESRLFKIYLHALTSHCAPDPLLGRTGVEEALNELRSEACLSFQHLETAELALLDLIRELTPRREFHPPRKQETETIRWHDIPPTCQVTGFEARVKDIVAYNEKLAVFRETVDDASSAKEPPQHSPLALLNRAAAREFGFANLLSAWSSGETVCDTVYHSRDGIGEFSEAAYGAALAVILRDPRKFPLPHPPELYKLFKNHWSPMVKRELGTDAPLLYDRTWLGKSDFSRTFLPLYDLCTSQTYSAAETKYSLLFSLPALAFGGGEEMRTIPYLIAFALLPERFSEITSPRYTLYDLQYGSYPRNEDLAPVLHRHIRPLEQTPSHGLMQLGDEEPVQFEARRRKHHNERATSRKKELSEDLLESWKGYKYNDALTLPNDAHYATYLNTAAILAEVVGIFQQCHRNTKLKAFATKIQNSLSPLGIPKQGGIFPSLMTTMDEDIVEEPRPHHVVHTPFINRLLRERDPPSLDDHVLNDLSGPGIRALSNSTSDAPSVVALERTLAEFSETDVALQSKYGRDIQNSLVCLKASLQPTDDMQDDQPIDIGLHLANCRADFDRLFNAIQSFLGPQSESERLLSAGGSWPCLNTRVLLHQMSRTRWMDLSAEWQSFLVTFAISIVRLQQAERLSWLAGLNKREEVERELGNLRLPDASLLVNHPDWLLIMIEQNFFARAIQIRVALEMFAPSSGKNTALQLNMGEGKSSVIAPMVATSLADGNKLVRIVVLKPLAKQMYQLLVDRLSSLPNRRICYFPFSRQMKTGPGGMTRIHNLNMQCMLDGGIVVIQPEHILSAKLLTIDKLLSMHDAREALAAQQWLEERARDILDESDEVLHVRYQLIYTKGTQFPMEGHPQRWTVIQDVLRLAATKVDDLKADADKAGDKANLLEVSRRVPSAFPHIKIPQHDGDEIAATLRSQIVESIMDGELSCLNITRFNAATKKALRGYLTNMEANNEGLLLKRNLTHTAAFNVVLILRGVLVYGLLMYALQDRRWRVDYGLDLSRPLLAVPYRAKDLPSLRSEFGHPDIAILLTCLAYYYHGLNREQMDATLKHLLMLSNPVDHYEQWIRVIPDEDLPAGLRDINGINIDDARQRNEIFELFRYNRVVVDFYLANIVFPKAAKEFPHKLPTSGWDLAEKKANVTTGFSGTNDNRYLLPTSITQEDPVDQGGTNALVLTYLLRPENASYHCTRNRGGKSSSGIEIIKLISSKPAIRVLLDVGAQMLDMSNQALVENWLALMPADVEAGIFFNSEDEFTTITRAGIVEPLISSPFKNQTGKCIVYLDDAHTRGTDLKLPLHWQAAVTLGKKVTKDRLIDAAIRRVAEKPSGRLKISDVIKWCMLETCADIEHHVPQWVQQGIDYDARKKALQSLRSIEELTEGNIRPVESVWLQKEARTLAEMYEGGTSVPIGRYIRRHPLLAERLTMMGLQALAHDNMGEEQEREVIHEMEVERHPERPPPLEDAKHVLDPDVTAFVKTGVIPESSTAFHHIATVLDRVRYWSDHSGNAIFDDNILVTTDFALTVQRDGTHIEVEFWKQAHWFLSTNIADADPSRCYVVLVSQWELQRLLYLIRNKGQRSPVRLHMYSPKVTRSAQSFDDLSFFSIPPLQPNSPRPSKASMLQLNLFSGQLYPSSFEDYSTLCEFLGLDITGTFNSQPDGFVLPANRRDSMQECPFTVSPVRFLKELMAVRRKGHDFGLTPIGKLLNGHRMTAEDFE
ncbi:hypothetical protein BDZ89DRAFT_1075364 [Hymenopellis radicata]|nr:hypothetical protein BDZ89DRAFT_1075364 [Hymenopellis radicata]